MTLTRRAEIIVEIYNTRGQLIDSEPAVINGPVYMAAYPDAAFIKVIHAPTERGCATIKTRAIVKVARVFTDRGWSIPPRITQTLLDLVEKGFHI